MTNDWKNQEKGVIVAYFADGEDAHLAITELLDSGFSAGDIGAVFHSGRASVSASATGEAVNDVKIRSTVSPGTAGSGSGISGAASDTSAVTPAGLSTGAGTATSGASRPGPIPGGEIPGDLPTNIPSTLRSEAEVAAQPARASYAATGSVRNPVVRNTVRHDEGGSWWDRLKHVFGGESAEEKARERREAVADKSSTNFGTGEGHLGVYPEYDYAYSSSAFESAFAGMGLSPERARYLSGQIGRRGAIVTVSAGSRSALAEQILERNNGERNNGQIRYEAGSVVSEDAGQKGEPVRVEIFGEVQRIYPRYVGPGTARAGSAAPEVERRKVS